MKRQMKADERALLLKGWTERLSDLVDVDMWDALHDKFRLAPYRDDNVRRPDAYAKGVESIYWKLHEQVEALTFLTERAQSDATREEDAAGMFDAWEVGLCPLAVKAHPELGLRLDYGQRLKEIASYRNEDSLSYEDTEHAIEIWSMEKRRTA